MSHPTDKLILTSLIQSLFTSKSFNLHFPLIYPEQYSDPSSSHSITQEKPPGYQYQCQLSAPEDCSVGSLKTWVGGMSEEMSRSPLLLGLPGAAEVH